MSVALTYRSIITVKETISLPADVLAAAGMIVHDQFNTSQDLTSSTPVPVTMVSSQILALAVGVATLNLTALPGANGVTIDGTGLKLRAMKIKGITGKSVITIVQGAANPYYTNATNTWKWVVAADQETVAYFGNTAAVIAAGAKNIDFAGTGTDTINVELVLG